MNLYEITIFGFDPVRRMAPNAGKAKYNCFLDFTDAYPCTFEEFLKAVKVRRVATSNRDTKENDDV